MTRRAIDLLSFLPPEACPVLRTAIKRRTIKKAAPVEEARLAASSLPSRRRQSRRGADQVSELQT